VNVAVDTNILVRGVVRDDAVQASAADRVLKNATLIAISLPCLCEFAWVLDRVYNFNDYAIAAAIRALLNIQTVAVNRPAVEAGLALLEAGGDFADGIMAHEGRWLGGDTFVSFDRQAVKLLTRHGQAAQIPA